MFNVRFILVVFLSFNALSNAFISSSSTKQKSNNIATRTTNLYGFFDDLLTKKSPSSPSSKPRVELPPDFQLPEPKPLSLTSTADVPGFIKSSLAFAVRLGTGAFTLGWKIDNIFFQDPTKYSLKLGPIAVRDSSSVLQNAPRPEKSLILYEYESSPYCKRVREMINLLDLSVEYRPCPGARQGKFSQDLLQRTGRQTVPYLIDPNTGSEMFESNDQIEYLLNTYGPPSSEFDRKALWPITFEAFSIFTSTLVAIIREMPSGRRQENTRQDNESMKPLELWGYESSPFVRPVREKLCSLCLPHIMVSCPRGSSNRDKMVERTGRFQVPFLIDPNTGIEMFEGPEIVEYLEKVYCN